MEKVSFDILSADELRKLRKPPSIRQGLYFLWSGEEIVYIGQSGNLDVRITQHLTNPSHRMRDTNITGVSMIEFDSDLELMGSIYINSYKPKLNKAKMK